VCADLRHDLGRLGERFAGEHLERRGFDLVERNYRTRWGELDLIGYDGETLAFVEVKTRRSGSGAPFDALHERKRRQVRRMAATWLAERAHRPRAAELRFDAIGVTIDAHGQLVELNHLEGAF
jgi:putative endonuclease